MHAIALYLLKSIKGAHRILQKKYLVVLCTLEICLLVAFLLESTQDIQERSAVLDTCLITLLTGFVSYQYILLVLILIDKFTCIYMPLRYNSLFTRRYTNRILTFMALMASTIASAFLALYFCYDISYTKVLHLAAICVWVPFDIIVLIISILVYGYFAVVRSKLKQLDAWRQLMASTAILVSFILFYIIPDLTIAITGDAFTGLHDIMFTLFIINSICDAVFITFLNREIRTRFLNMVICRSNEVLPQ